MSAIDLAFTTGQRQTSLRPSRSARIDTGRTTVRSRDFERPVAEPLQSANGFAAGAAGLADAFGKFFPALVQMEVEEDVEQAKRENTDEILRLEAEVRKDRSAAREAIRTGDYSKFIPDDDMRRRRVIKRSFESMVAQQMAYEDFDTKLRDAINQTPLSGDPQDTVEQFLSENLEGADPVFAQAYASTLQRAAAESISAFKESRLQLQQAESERRGVELIQSEISAGHVPATAEGLTAMRRKVTGALPMNAADAVVRTDALVDSTIIKMASQGNTTALKLGEIADPDRDGTSVFSRNPGKLQAAVNSYIKNKEKISSAAAHNSLEKMEDRLSLIEAGQPVQGDSVYDLWVDVWNHREKFGDSSAWDSVRDKVSRKVDDAGVQQGTAALIAEGLTPRMSNSKWNKTAEKLWSGELTELVMQQGNLSEAAAQTRIMQTLGRRGSGKELVDHNSAALLNSADAAEVSETFTRLKSLDGVTKNDMSGWHLKEDAADLYKTMLWAERSGKDPLEVRQSYLTAVSEGAVPRNHLAKRLTDPGDEDSETIGRAGVSSHARLVWDELKKDGWFTEDGPLSPSDENYADVSPNVRARMEESLNKASFLLSGTNASLEDIRALGMDLAIGSLGLEMDADGEVRATLDQSPPIATAPDGTPVPGEKVTKEVLMRGREALKMTAAAAVVTAIGGFGGLKQDTLTAAGQGLAVRSVASGFEQDVVLPAGATRAIPLSDLPENFPGTKFFEEVKRDEQNDTLMVKVPDAPERTQSKRIEFTESLFMVYDRERGGWTLRYKDKGVPAMSLEDLSKKNREERGEITPADVRGARRLRDNPFAPGEAFERREGSDYPEAEAEIPEDIRESLEGRSVTVPLPGQQSSLEVGTPATAGFSLAGPLEALIGSPVPDDDAPGPLSAEERAGIRESREAALDAFQARNVVSPQARSETFLPDDIKESLPRTTELLILREKSWGGWLDDMSAPRNEQFLVSVKNFITDHEGAVPYVYDDATGRRWNPNKPKGNPTVGIGFNLNRPDAREMLKKVGADYDKLLKGEDALSDSQQRELLSLSVKPVINWLRDHFDGVQMANHRWAALISLTYNSRWDKDGPTIIGPRLTEAVRSKDWKAASEEIAERSGGGVRPNQQAGINARRALEARMFRQGLVT